MLESLFNSTSIPVLEQVVNFSQARHNVLAGNIANMDTPGYRTRDLSPEMFEGRLKQAIAERDRGEASFNMGSAGSGDPFSPVRDDLQGMLRHDDGNVGIERQITEIAKNQMQHNLALTILNSQFRLLQAAIAERV